MVSKSTSKHVMHLLFLSPTTTFPHSLPMCVPHFIHVHTSLYSLSGDSTAMAKFGEAMRGLTVFISDIRNCECPIPMLWDGFWEWDYIVLVSCPHFPLLRKVWERDWYCVWPVMCFAMRSSCSIILCFTGKSKEAERKRINKELANIRSKFKSE